MQNLLHALSIALTLTTALANPFLTEAVDGRTLLERGFPKQYESATEFEPFRPSCKSPGRVVFMVSIKDKTVAKNHICGGVLIAKNAVLTAAHCVDPRATRNAIVLPQVTLAGANLADYVERFQTVGVFPHPKWTGDIRDGHDLVILKLVKKSCLTPIKTIGKEKLGKKSPVEFFGYGRTGGGGAHSVVLQSAFLNSVSSADCAKKHGIQLRDNELCFSGDAEDVAVCTGDDGGPLLSPPEGLFGVHEELIAIASYSSSDCTKKGATVFMNVHAFKKWIDDTRDK